MVGPRERERDLIAKFKNTILKINGQQEEKMVHGLRIEKVVQGFMSMWLRRRVEKEVKETRGRRYYNKKASQWNIEVHTAIRKRKKCFKEVLNISNI